jgi:hypothetical protein
MRYEIPCARLWEQLLEPSEDVRGRRIMEQRPSEGCENCVGWHEDPLLCVGCPNDPESGKTKDSDERRTAACQRESWN